MAYAPGKNPNSLANLIPAKKGEVLNPLGRRGKLSMLDAIRAEMGQLAPENPDAQLTNNEYIAKRLVHIAKNAADGPALQAITLLLKYFEGEPSKPISLE